MAKSKIYCFGANHRSAPLDLRESFYMDPSLLGPLLTGLAQAYQFDELMVLSTCNRFEMYGLAREGSCSQELMMQAFCDLQQQAGKSLASQSMILNHTYFYEGLAAIEHIFAVTASLDSLIVGETQITGQFKDALLLAAQKDTLGPHLDRLGQEALAVAKQVRSRTKIGEKTVSISHAAINLAKKVFQDLGERRFLIVGAGEMAQVAAQYACHYQPKGLYLVNRTFARAKEFADTLPMGEARPWEELDELLQQVDIVVSSTASLQAIISFERLEAVMRKRKHRTLFLVDIAIPRDIEPRCAQLDEVYLFELDDLQTVVDEHQQVRLEAASQGRLMVHKAALLFERWLNAVAIKPALAGFRDYLDELVQREATKTLGRAIFSHLSAAQSQAIEEMLKSIAAKILSDAARTIHSHDDAHFQEQLVSSLRLMFARKPSIAQPQALALKEQKPLPEQEKEETCRSKVIRL